MRNFILFVFPIILGTTLAAAPTPAAEFSVRISDGLGRPVPGATVQVSFVRNLPSNVVDQVSLAKATSNSNGLAAGTYDLGAVSRDGAVSIEVSKTGYATTRGGPESSYVLKKIFHADDIARITKLDSRTQRTDLTDLLAGEFESPKLGLAEMVFINESKLRQTLRYLIADPQVGLVAGELLSFMGLPEDMPLIIQYGPSSGNDPAVTRWANAVVSALLEPGSEREWQFLKRCAQNEFGGHWVDAAAIRTLKLMASSRSVQLLNDARKANPDRAADIDQAITYANSKKPPLADTVLATAARKTAMAVNDAGWMGNDDPRYNAEKDMALVDCNFLVGGREYHVFTVTLQKVGDTWKLRGVRETKQTLLPGAPAHK